MKIRHCLVSNSSSSSFCIIDHTQELSHKDQYKGETLIVDRNFGNTQFGWENEKYNYMGDRVTFSYLQANYVRDNKPEWLYMLENVLKEHLGCGDIIWNLSTEYDDPEKDYSYIDHQSASYEGENTEMFASEEALKQFLFCDGSYIQGGNDNDY